MVLCLADIISKSIGKLLAVKSCKLLYLAMLYQDCSHSELAKPHRVSVNAYKYSQITIFVLLNDTSTIQEVTNIN